MLAIPKARTRGTRMPACRQLHPRICQESWKTGKCDEGGMCGDGYHLGDGPGKPRTKSHYGIHYGTPMGLGEGPGKPRTKNHYGTPGRQRKRASRRITENLPETDKTTKGDQDASKGLTIHLNNRVTTQAENLKELDRQARKMDSPKE